MTHNKPDKYFAFDTYQHTVSGNAGCNRISGRLEHTATQPNIIRLLQVASTRMACLDEQKTAWENEFLKTIQDVVRFEPLSAEGMTPRIALYGIDNNRLFILRKK
ncbi:MAG: META domain-containing protein [Tannerellaceae bacterium]|nr:META domain-containing protein [Tannerellaceae bacterium]